MHTFIQQPLQIGSLSIPHRLIQGPLAGFSCAPFRVLFQNYQSPAYCVTEMISAQDVLSKHDHQSRYLYRSPKESLLAYQLSGTCPHTMAQAALKLERLGADLIDINCGCPKTKIRKKGAGSALLESPKVLQQIIRAIKNQISIPLTVKIRIQNIEQDIKLAQLIEQAGADALIVHGRTWRDDYDVACNYAHLSHIKNNVGIPVIANGDIASIATLDAAIEQSGCDAFMVGRAGTGKPWLFKELLWREPEFVSLNERIQCYLSHLHDLATLEDEFKAILQGKSLIRYYFRNEVGESHLQDYYALQTLDDIAAFMNALESVYNSLT